MTRDIFERLGFDTFWTGPGPDGGRDLTAVEKVDSPVGLRNFRWLVNCKDHAKSDVSVRESELGSIVDKCHQHETDGFVLVTTTQPSSAAVAVMDGITRDRRAVVQCTYIDSKRLESLLMRPEMEQILRSYLPESYSRLEQWQLRRRSVLSLTGLDEAGRRRVQEAHQIEKRRVELHGRLPDVTEIWGPHREWDGRMEEVMKAVLVDGDISRAQIAIREIPRAIRRALINKLALEFKDQVKEFLWAVAGDVEEVREAYRVDSIEILRERYSLDFEDVISLCRGLDRYGVTAVLAPWEFDEKVGETLSEYMTEGDGWSEISELATHVTLEEVELEDVLYGMTDGQITFEGLMTLPLGLQWGSDRDQDRGEGHQINKRFPGRFWGYIDHDQTLRITRCKVDSSSLAE